MKKFLLRSVMALPLAIAGCINDPQGMATSSVTLAASQNEGSDLGLLTYRAVDLILAAAPNVTATTPIVVASISDIQNVDRGSALGNIVSEFIRTRLAQDGRLASEIRLRTAINFNKGEGEFLLSRDRRALMAPPNASAIVTGTYAVSSERVYVSIKLVSAIDSHIIAGADFAVPLQNVDGLLYGHRT
jgi:TolB-like protein